MAEILSQTNPNVAEGSTVCLPGAQLAGLGGIFLRHLVEHHFKMIRATYNQKHKQTNTKGSTIGWFHSYATQMSEDVVSD